MPRWKYDGSDRWILESSDESKSAVILLYPDEYGFDWIVEWRSGGSIEEEADSIETKSFKTKTKAMAFISLKKKELKNKLGL